MTGKGQSALARRIEAGWWQNEHAPAAWLRGLAAGYGALVAVRRALVRGGWLRQERLPVPVIVVGNRIVGGAGKTPVTIALVRALGAAGWHPGVISRGHGRRGAAGAGSASLSVTATSQAADVGDEPLLIARRTGVPVMVDRDRPAAGRALLAQHPAVDLLVCDDGLQHLRLARDVELVVFDERGVGNGRLLPAGPLREPVVLPTDPHIRRHTLYNAGQPSTAEPGLCLTRQLTGAVSLAGWWSGEPASMPALTALARPQPGVPVLICAGLGHPGRFAAMLAELGVVARVLDLPDHHDYARLPWPETPCEVLVTEKDAVKLDPGRVAAERPQSRVWVVPLELDLPAAWLADLQAALG